MKIIPLDLENELCPNYKETLEKELGLQIQRASLNVRNESLSITNEFDVTLELSEIKILS